MNKILTQLEALECYVEKRTKRLYNIQIYSAFTVVLMTFISLPLIYRFGSTFPSLPIVCSICVFVALLFFSGAGSRYKTSDKQIKNHLKNIDVEIDALQKYLTSAIPQKHTSMPLTCI